MKLIKVKAIVIKEISYRDNDKIVTLLTDELGRISAIARGAKKTKSSILANTQFLVYSEFILYKNKDIYYVNSASILNMFYKLRTNLDMIGLVFNLTKILQSVTDENQDTTRILSLFLNTLYVLENSKKDSKLIIATFKIKLLSLLGFTPKLDVCYVCKKEFDKINEECEFIYFDYVDNNFLCVFCAQEDKRRYIKISKATFYAINYVIASDLKKVFSFELKNIYDFDMFGQVYADTVINGL
ncbi:MAG: DNA repair protein RecO [Clostridia bacterium]